MSVEIGWVWVRFSGFFGSNFLKFYWIVSVVLIYLWVYLGVNCWFVLCSWVSFLEYTDVLLMNYNWVVKAFF